jgi:hypothetical protein
MNDVWLFTGAPGTTWTSLWAYPSPPHRAVGRGIYDPVTGLFVVFGGQYDESGNGGSGSYLNDTWGFQAAAHPRPPYLVSGVVSSVKGVAISGAKVYANTTGSNFVTTTSSTGSFSFSLDNGTYQTTAIAAGYVPSTRSVLVAGEPVPGVNFQLANPTVHTYKVTGKVTDTSGIPIVTATVSYVLDGTPGSVPVSPAGYFTVLLPNGTYVLTIAAPGYESKTTSATVSGHNIDTGHFELMAVGTAPTYKVTGRVTDASGNPIVTATVSYVLNGTPDSVSVNPSGYFTILLPNGTYVLTIAAAGYVSQTTNVTVSGHDVSVGRIKLVT